MNLALTITFFIFYGMFALALLILAIGGILMIFDLIPERPEAIKTLFVTMWLSTVMMILIHLSLTVETLVTSPAP
jgi:hypothetical protein